MNPGREDEAFYRDLLESVTEASPDLVYFKDADHRLVHVGETYAEIFDGDREDLLGKTAHDLWPDSAEAIISDEKRTLAGEKVIDRERLVTHPDGTEHWYSVNKIPRYDDAGNVVGFFAIDREITEQKEREFELERYRAFVEHASDIITIVDPEGYIGYVSPSITDFAGYEPEAFVGEFAMDYVHPDDHGRVADAYRRLLTADDGDLTIEYRFRTADDSWAWIESAGANRIEAKGIDGVVLISREITERKAKERALRESRRRYQSLFENNPLVIWEEDFTDLKPELDTLAEETGSLETYLRETPEEVERLLELVEVISVNENAVDYYGAESKDHLLENLGGIFTRESRDHVIKEFVAVANDETRFRMETVSQTLDGKRREELLDLYVPEAYADDFSRVYLTSTDITERKDLHQRLSVVNRILRHDIRSAVSIIRGNADLAKASERALEEVLETITSEADRLYRLAENARHIEGVLSSRGPTTEELDLAPLVTAKLLNYQNHVPEASIEYDIPETATARASVRFQEAFEELLTNAIEHNDKDQPEIAVTITDRPGENGWVELRVADNGRGIPRDEIKPIERGVETDLTHTSGLGLWVVYWAVKESGGEIEFEPNDPTGTIVTIRLPAVE